MEHSRKSAGWLCNKNYAPQFFYCRRIGDSMRRCSSRGLFSRMYGWCFRCQWDPWPGPGADFAAKRFCQRTAAGSYSLESWWGCKNEFFIFPGPLDFVNGWSPLQAASRTEKKVQFQTSWSARTLCWHFLWCQTSTRVIKQLRLILCTSGTEWISESRGLAYLHTAA